MSTPRRKPLGGDPDALGFVFQKPDEPAPPPGAAPPAADQPLTTSELMNQLLQPAASEKSIRFTADLPESLHRKLTMLAARSGKKKVEIVRAILEEVLKDVEL